MSNLAGTHSSEDPDLSWQDYEELVRDIYEALGRATDVTIECWGSSCRVEGPPGIFHQIDVLTTHSEGLHAYRTAISCKNWNAKVDLPVVRDFAQITQEAGLSKGVIVSKMGFTGPAKDLAQTKNIGLVELRKPVDADWAGRIRKVHISIVVDQTQIDDVRFDLIPPKPTSDQEVPQVGAVRCPFRLDQVHFRTHRLKTQTLQQVFDRELRAHPNEPLYEVSFPEGTVVAIPENPQHPAHGHLIARVWFRVVHNPPLREEFVVNADDHIYMIMESIFDGRRFTISQDGQIRETQLSGEEEVRAQ